MLLRLLVAAALAADLNGCEPAFAQTAQVVPDCSGVIATVGTGGRLYVDQSGRLCTSGGGNVSGLAASQTIAATTVSVLCPARVGRRAATLQNLGTTPVFFGPSGVSATTGGLLPGSVGASVTLNTSAAVYGLTASGTQAVACIETY